MKQKTIQRIRGSITILLVIILLGTMTFSAVVVDTSRLNMMRGMVDSAADLALNSALANYDTILKDVYGLFAMSQNMSEEDLTEELRKYFAKTLVSYGVTTEAGADDYLADLLGDFRELVAGVKDRSSGNFMNVDIEDFKVTRVENSSLVNPEILRKQIVEYMKYRGPLSFGLSFLDSLNAFQRIESQTAVVEKQVEAQEKSQDVSAACNSAIQEFRTFDKLVDALQSGGSQNVDGINAKGLVGKADKDDGVSVLIRDYHLQVDGYRASWGGGADQNENYQDINEMLLVFLQNTPDISKYDLSGKGSPDQPQNRYIQDATNELDTNNVPEFGSLGVVTYTDKEGARQQLHEVEDLVNGCKSDADKYNNTNFLPEKLVVWPGDDGFTNDKEAIRQFIRYEQFLRNEDNDSGLHYNEISIALQQLYRMKLAFDMFNSIIQGEIDQAKQELDEAETVKNDAWTAWKKKESEYEDAKNNLIDPDTAISNTIDKLNEDVLEKARDLLEGAGGTFDESRMQALCVNELDEVSSYSELGISGGSDNYLSLFVAFLNVSSWSDATNTSVIEKAQEAYDKSSKNPGSFTSFTVSSSESKTTLYKLLSYILKAHDKAQQMRGIKENYAEAKQNVERLRQEAVVLQSDYETKERDYNEKDQKHRDLVTDQEHEKQSMLTINSSFKPFTDAYQQDLAWYPRYISAAKGTINKLCETVANQFSQLQTNIDAIVAQLKRIETSLNSADTQIGLYEDFLNTWETANNSYEKSGGDGFSGQNKEDIKAARTEYNRNSLETLQLCVKLVREEYELFQSRLKDGIHYKYGTTRIIDIRNWETALEAFRNSGQAGPFTGEIATIKTEDAERVFSALYPDDPTTQIECMEGATEQWQWLKPTVVPNQFLRYLNGTYPDPETNKENTKVSGQYDSIVSDMGKDEPPIYDTTVPKTNSQQTANPVVGGPTAAGKGSEGASESKGYTYDGRSATGSLPSGIVQDKNVDPKNFKISKDGDKVSGSGAMKEQQSTLSTMLSGLGNVAMAGVENLYVLGYIFENFSYNTIAQELAVKEDGGVEKLAPLDALSKASGLPVSNYYGKSMTLSNHAISAGNNYFYGAEVEYILYGKADAASNVKLADASIYAIRFAFDCIFAFTNSEIRNIARAAGLAVQAATLGIVPYQVVMVVVQLAMAAVEAKLDLDLMKLGLRVAVVKTKDSWGLSVSRALKSAGEIVADKAVDVVTTGIGNLTSGLQNLVDCGADQLGDAVKDVIGSAQDAATGAVQEVADQAFGIIQNKIEETLNEIKFYDFDENKVEVQAFVDQKFFDLRKKIDDELSLLGGNPIGDKVKALAMGQVNGILVDVKAEVDKAIKDAEDPAQSLVSAIVNIKIKLMSIINGSIESISDQLKEAADEAVSSLKTTLNDKIGEVGNDLSEQAADEVREQVQNATNDFISQYIEPNEMIGDGLGGAGGSGMSNGLASAIKFGYKDYLMLFVFIGLCVDSSSDNILKRTADMIQLNIQNNDGVDYTYKDAGNFLMQDARTYANVKAEVGLNMLFMRLDYFQDPLIEAGVSEDTFGPATIIQYNGLGGY